MAFDLQIQGRDAKHSGSDRRRSGDQKNDAKYVVWWPEHGGRVDGWPIIDVPQFIVQAITDNTLGVTLKTNGSDVTPMCVYLDPPTAFQFNYAKRALGNACYELRQCREGRRNDLLNVMAYKMGRLIAQGWINRELVEDYLLRCCGANGLIADDGLTQCRLTLASGINAGTKQPYQIGAMA
jgi:hypothetical protein